MSRRTLLVLLLVLVLVPLVSGRRRGPIPFLFGLANTPGVGTPDVLHKISQSTGNATRVAALPGFENLSALATQGDLTLLAFNSFPKELVYIDRRSGLATGLFAVQMAVSENIEGMDFGCDGLLYAAFEDGVTNAFLATVDLSSGVVTPVHPSNDLGTQKVTGFAIHPTTCVGYAFDQISDRLLEVDPSLGTASLIGSGPTGCPQIDALAFSSASVLYGVPADTRRLVQLSLTTGQCTDVGATGINNAVTGLGWASNATRSLYAVSGQNLYSVDTGTGVVRLVGATGFGNLASLTTRSDGMLVAENDFPKELIEIDPATAQAAVVTPLSISISDTIQALSYDCADTLYATLLPTGGPPANAQLVTINEQTGAVAVVHPTNDLGAPDVNGLAFDPTDCTSLYGVIGSTDELLAINPSDGSAVVIGVANHGVGDSLSFADGGALFSNDITGMTLVFLNKSSGASIAIGSWGLSLANVTGMTWGPR